MRWSTLQVSISSFTSQNPVEAVSASKWCYFAEPGPSDGLRSPPGSSVMPCFPSSRGDASAQRKELHQMAIRIKARGSESVEQMLRRFKKLCEKEGLTKEVKKRQYYEKPSERRRRDDRKSAARVARGGR